MHYTSKTVRIKKSLIIIVVLSVCFLACQGEIKEPDIRVLFLHHSTGRIIWQGGDRALAAKIAGKISENLSEKIQNKSGLPALFAKHNKSGGITYLVDRKEFPKASPYGWNNYPYDYYNIWVKNGGNNYFQEEPTLETLTQEYEVIIFKHCYPVSNIQPDNDSTDVNSALKTLSNYKLQYLALRSKLHEFPETKFILFTGAVQVKNHISDEEALRAQEFFRWVIDEWDITEDNIYIWDLYSLQTEGGLYFKDEYAVSDLNSHPNEEFANRVVKLLSYRIIDVIENNGATTYLTGEEK